MYRGGLRSRGTKEGDRRHGAMCPQCLSGPVGIMTLVGDEVAGFWHPGQQQICASGLTPPIVPPVSAPRWWHQGRHTRRRVLACDCVG